MPLQDQRSEHSWRHVIIILTGLLGSIASVGVFLALCGWQNRVADLRFTGLARDHLQTINAGLTDATEVLYSIRGYYESLDHIPTRAEFQAFSAVLRKRAVGLRDTGWAPRVTLGERDRF